MNSLRDALIGGFLLQVLLVFIPCGLCIMDDLFFETRKDVDGNDTSNNMGTDT